MSEVYSLERAGRWFLDSGIQQPSGGVARFYLADIQENKPVSTEITGYTASALAFLYQTTGEEVYLERARLTASFLIDQAWNPSLGIFPFELDSPLAFFFDSGIIIRGLLAVWRITNEQKLLEVAIAAARGMRKDFYSGRDYHPIVELPAKKPVPRARRWSCLPGCYQAKSALAWREVAAITGDEELGRGFAEILTGFLNRWFDFLPGTEDRHGIMDRLHAAGYFLEALSPVLNEPVFVETYRKMMGRVSHYLREIAPDFARSDVYAQLLRARIYAAPAIPVDRNQAREEAEALTGFQRPDGGFWFGRRAGRFVPHVNPVSTAFAIQALEVWRAFESGEPNPCPYPTI